MITPNITGFFFAILSMLCLGIGTFLYKQSTLELGPTHTMFFYYLFSIVLASLVWFLVADKPAVSKESLVWPALMALFLSSSVWTFSYALKTMEVSTASTIRGLSFLATLILAVLFYREELTLKDMVAVCFAVVAVVLFGLETTRLPK